MKEMWTSSGNSYVKSIYKVTRKLIIKKLDDFAKVSKNSRSGAQIVIQYFYIY